MRQTAKRRARNMSTKRDLKSAVKAFFASPSAASLSAAQSELDTAVKKNILPKNTAARRKSQLAKVAKEAGVKPASSAKATKAKAASTKPAAKAAAKPAAKKAASATAKATADKPAKKPTAKKPAAKKTTK